MHRTKGWNHFMIRLGCCLPGQALNGDVNANDVDAICINTRATIDAGYDYVETNAARLMALTDAELDRLAKAHAAGELPLECCNGFIPGTMPILCDPTRPELMDYVQEACRRMAQVGVQIVVFGSGTARTIPDGMSGADAQARLDAFLTGAEQRAREAGVTIVIEPLRSEETNLIHTVREGAAYVRRLNLPNLRLLADSYHMYCEREPLTSLVENADILRHVHVAEAPDRGWPGSLGGEYLRTFGAVLRGTPYCGRASMEGRMDDYLINAPHAVKFMRAAIGN